MYFPGPVYFALLPCKASAIAERGPTVNVRVGSELGPQIPDKVPSLSSRHVPPIVVRAFGFSMVTEGWGGRVNFIRRGEEYENGSKGLQSVSHGAGAIVVGEKAQHKSGVKRFG